MFIDLIKLSILTVPFGLIGIFGYVLMGIDRHKYAGELLLWGFSVGPLSVAWTVWFYT